MSTSEASVLTHATIEKLVTHSVAVVLEAQAAMMANNPNSKPRKTSVARNCAYEKFTSYQLSYFNGTDGAVGLIHWFKRTESIFSRSKCAEKDKVRFAASTLTKEDLFWWTQSIRIEEAYKITWTETADGETMILAKIDGKQRTITESSIRRALQLNDEKVRVKTLEDAEKRRYGVSQEDSPNRGGVDTRVSGEDTAEKEASKSTNKGSESTREIANILSTMGAANVLASGGLKDVVATASLQIPPASLPIPTASTKDASVVATAGEEHPTTTTRVATSYARRTRASKGIVLESSQPSQTTSMPTYSTKGKEKMIEPEKPSKKKMQEQLKIARVQTKEYLRQMINKLDRSNEMVNKHMEEYEAAEQDLSLEEKIDLITMLLNYQKNMAQVKKYQEQQQKLGSKTEWRKFYSSVLRSHAGWKAKDFKERIKRLGIQLEQRSSKRLKAAAKPSGSNLSDEELKKMMELIFRVGEFVELYQTFDDMLKKFNREDLDKLWSLVQETHKSRDLKDDKEKQLWVELKRLYEQYPKDQLWALQRYMHDPLVRRLYDLCGVHHVSTIRGHEIFMLVEKNYPLTKGLTTVRISNKL
ncbi:hypothetical protein Tco_1200648 [Tanacetum coccineum]